MTYNFSSGKTDYAMGEAKPSSEKTSMEKQRRTTRVRKITTSISLL